MIRSMTLAGLFMVATAMAGAAEDAPKYTGIWTKEADGVSLELNFKKAGELDYKVAAGDNSITMNCTYTEEKGLIKVKMVKKVIKGEFPFEPKDGFTFQFKIKIDKNKATVTDFDASENADAGKGAVEGEYVKKEEKKEEKKNDK